MPVQEEPGRSPERSLRSVGSVLAELRHAIGLTGAEVAERAGFSQAKLSKIENGTVSPKPSDILAIGRILGAPSHLLGSLIDQAESEPKQLAPWRSAGPTTRRAQHDISGLERAATEIRTLQVAVPPGLLQTEAYARAVLADYTRPLGQEGGPELIPAAVTERMRRQEILADQRKVFFFILAETVLLNRVARPATMLGQIERVREAASEPNVVVRVLRSGVELAYPPLHDFELLDDRVVILDTMTTTVVTRGHTDVRVYQRVFEYFWAQATPDIGPILDRYAGLYADLARPAGGAATGPQVAADLIAPPLEGDPT